MGGGGGGGWALLIRIPTDPPKTWGRFWPTPSSGYLRMLQSRLRLRLGRRRLALEALVQELHGADQAVQARLEALQPQSS